jgi:hypothetical protein
MILKARKIRPVITFGLGEYTKTLSIGDKFYVYLQGIYKETYNFQIVTDLDGVKINRTTWELEIKTSGVFTVKVYMFTSNNSVQRYSNTLTITV